MQARFFSLIVFLFLLGCGRMQSAQQATEAEGPNVAPLVEEERVESPQLVATTLKVLTFNVYDVPLGVSLDREERLQEICSRLAKGYDEGRWDVVFIQELWSDRFRKVFIQDCGFPHVVDFVRKGMPEEINFSLEAIETIERAFDEGFWLWAF